MRNPMRIPVLFAAFTVLGMSAAAAGEDSQPAPTPEEQIQALEEMCAASAEARQKRHAETPLYVRLGKDEKIHALTLEIVRLHLENEAIRHLFDEEYAEHVAGRVAEFMISGLGGPQVYDGPSLTESHAHMKLTDADFLAAGADVIQAMKNLEYGSNEIDEVVCALVSMRELVVVVE